MKGSFDGWNVSEFERKTIEVKDGNVSRRPVLFQSPVSIKMKLAIAVFCCLCFQLAHCTNARDRSQSMNKTHRKFQRKLTFFTEQGNIFVWHIISDCLSADVNNLVATGQRVARSYNTGDATTSTQSNQAPAPVKPTAPQPQTISVESNAGCRSVMEVIGSLTYLTTFSALIKVWMSLLVKDAKLWR